MAAILYVLSRQRCHESHSHFYKTSPTDDPLRTPKSTTIEINDDDDDQDDGDDGPGSEDHVAVPPLPPKMQFPLKPNALKSSAKGNSASNTPLSSGSSSAPVKTRGKRTHAEAFADENKAQNETLALLGTQKHERRLAELEVKKQKLQLALLEKTQLAEERRAAAEDRRREAEYVREREREKHQLVVLCQRTMMQNNLGSIINADDMGGFDFGQMFGSGNLGGGGRGMAGMNGLGD